MFKLGKDKLTVPRVISLIKKECKVEISEEVREQIRISQDNVEQIVAGNRTVYGVNTGFGPLCTEKISANETRKLQENILKSHAVGVGNSISDDLVRIMLLTKLHALGQGYSGVKLDTYERILFFFENDILPQVPEQGSVGASGDLAPLSHLFLPLLGLGKVKYKGGVYPTVEVYQKLGMAPIVLGAKEGLALINGTQFILSHAVLVVARMERALKYADVIGAMSLEGLRGSVSPFRKELHEIRPYKGTRKVAKNLRKLIKGSQIPASHELCSRVQDPYSLRCMPQVHGASRNAWEHLNKMVEIELNSVTDNPIVLGKGEAISGGNFHGQPLAMVLDYATLASAELGNIADRRIYLSLEGEKVNLPKLLLKETGLNSGFMILQYTTAALVSENKSLCFPASADSIPTSMGQEDHVSMGSISGRKCLQVLGNLEKIQAVEMICASQAIDFLRPLKSSDVLDRVHKAIRKHIPFFEKDEIFSEAIQNAIELLQSDELLQIVEEEIKL